MAINLKGNDTSTYSSDVETNGYLYAKGSSSYLVVERTGATGSTTLAEFGGDSVTARISADGSATFAGRGVFGTSKTGSGSCIVIQNTDETGRTVDIKRDGSVTFASGNLEISDAGYLKIDRDTGASGVLRGSLNGTPT